MISNPDYNNVFLTIGENDLVERVFKFPNGQNDEQYLNITSDAGSNTITIVTQIQYVDDPRNVRPGSDPVTLPTTYGMNINLIAVDFTTVAIVDRTVRAFVTVDPPPGEYGMNINFIAVATTSPMLVESSVRAFVTVDSSGKD